MGKARDRRVAQMRCLARLVAQAELAHGECLIRGRIAEARAWGEVIQYLRSTAKALYDRGLPMTQTLW